MDSKHIFGGALAAFLFGSNFAGNTDVIIVGAGVAGSALAYAFRKDCLDGFDSQTVFSFAAVHKDGKRGAISFPSNSSARGFHYGRFVQKLRQKAASLPNVNLEQGTVTSLVEENGSIKGVLYKTKAGQELAASASLTIVCDGCFSNLRSNLCNPKVKILH
ncbi:SQUALENE MONOOXYGENASE [Salix purpurea]|uniref:Squalene monooxygenase n=1 Tax=Salix purpurea TaxID=77065 RepID=A0A9Q0V8E0_SALPP|nr:SQUALENE MONOOXYGENASE [Salix purpurea]